MSPGDAVTWIEKRRDGSVSRAVFSRILSIQTVNGRAGSVDCAVLACNRFVPVSQLIAGHHSQRTERANNGGREAAAGGVSKPVSRRLATTQRRESTAAVDSRHDHRAGSVSSGDRPRPMVPVGSDDGRRAAAGAVRAVQPAAVPVVAFDFLNLLVRAFHAGKPTETHAVVSMFRTVANTINRLKPAHVVFALDGGHVRRSELLPQYKAHRPEPEALLKQQKALAEMALLAAGFQCVRVDGWEADDVIASIVEQHSGAVICSSDKDLLSLAGRARVWLPWGDGGWITPDEKLGLPAGQVSEYLALCGDSSDGVPGVQGIGPKTALKLLKDWGNLEAIAAAAITGQIKGTVGERIKEQQKMLWLCLEVIALNRSLPVPQLQSWRPPAGWQQAMQGMRLGAVVAALESLQIEDKQKCSAESLSAPTGQGERLEVSAGGNPESPPASVPDQIAEGTAANALTVSSAVATSSDGRASLITRSITEPIRRGLSLDELWHSHDRGLILQWELGRKKAAAGEPRDSGWKEGSELRVAWLQGFDGQDLCVQVGRESVGSQHPANSRQGSLF